MCFAVVVGGGDVVLADDLAEVNPSCLQNNGACIESRRLSLLERGGRFGRKIFRALFP